MFEAASRRFLDILASIYIYNEHRGYSSIDRVLEAVYARHPDEKEFIAAVEKHRRDERKHYLMFRRYFEARGYMPYEVDRSCGHIDRFIRLTFGCGIDDLDTDAVIASDELFFRLCRVIMLTEIRGMNQLDVLLENALVKTDRSLMKIFTVVQRDEPTHWMPYRDWLQARGGSLGKLSEKLADAFVHASLVFWKVPTLFFNPGLKRRTSWQDEGDPKERLSEALEAAVA
jgi:hypothetical protein